MKKTPIIFSLFCVLTVLFAAACSNGSTESAKTTAPLKQAAPKKPEETYILGDADGNGVINIDDATLLQRLLCELVADTDGKITQRGDVDGNGLNIMDVTEIMKYIAELDVEYSIGEQIAPTAAEQTTTYFSDESTEAASHAAPTEVTSAQDQTNETAEQTKPAPTQPATTAVEPPQETTEPDLTLGENDLPFDDL